jgi:hypothetical protein
MRRLLLVLITLSLSWVTMGYACDMSGAVAQSVCCCDAGSSASCQDPSRDCSSSSMFGAPGESCCSLIATSGTSIQGQAESLSTPNVVLLNRPLVFSSVEPPPPRIAISPSLLAPAAAAAPLFLLIGHILR